VTWYWLSLSIPHLYAYLARPRVFRRGGCAYHHLGRAADGLPLRRPRAIVAIRSHERLDG
jgi:hypothetical protein